MALSNDAVAGRARALRLLLLDVDGVLTDGSVVMQRDGDLKAFFIRDGAALVWAQREGLEIGFLSGRPSPVTTNRAAELGISLVVQQPDKQAAYAQIVAARGLGDEEVGFMGDDLLDLPILRRVGLSAAPADAAGEVLTRVDWVSRYPGGRGAVRELIEVVLSARGRWDAVVNSYLA